MRFIFSSWSLSHSVLHDVIDLAGCKWYDLLLSYIDFALANNMHAENKRLLGARICATAVSSTVYSGKRSIAKHTWQASIVIYIHEHTNTKTLWPVLYRSCYQSIIIWILLPITSQRVTSTAPTVIVTVTVVVVLFPRDCCPCRALESTLHTVIIDAIDVL